MSDHPKEADRNLKRFFICDDIYLDVFRLLAPAKVGLELALVSNRFDALVDTHFKTRKWTLGVLEIDSENIVKINSKGPEKTLPFPKKPLPTSIVGFDYLEICLDNSDSDAIVFLRRIRRLLVSDVCLKLHIYGDAYWNEFVTAVWPLLNVAGIMKLFCRFPSDFQRFRRIISPSILCDCSNLRMISFDLGLFFHFPPDDSKGSSAGQAMCKWLHTPRADGQPKVLRTGYGGDGFPMDALKTAFLNATTSVSFIIRLPSIFSFVDPFALVNLRTHEQLISQKRSYDGENWDLIKRSPIDKSAKQWAEWEREAMTVGEFSRCKVLRVYQ